MTKEKKITYLDYLSQVGERVRWLNFKHEHFEGKLIKMDENYLATVELDNGTLVEVQC
jgi:hypothetical protein